jgi:protein-S-isoprenylcysteine O-methyltransferase Ste14
MAFLRFIAAFVLWFELPVPFYWFILHPYSAYWRRRQRTAFMTAIMVWPIGFLLLVLFYRDLFAQQPPRTWALTAGFLLIFLEGWLFVRVKRDLGAARLIGKTELEGGGEMQIAGVYRFVRHPRYAGMLGAVIGAGLLAGTLTLWIVIALWTPLALLAIRMEEKELERRFGAAYIEYSRAVPRFLPIRFRARTR